MMIKQGQPECWKVTKGKVFCKKDGTFDGEYITFCNETILQVKKYDEGNSSIYVLFILGSKSVFFFFRTYCLVILYTYTTNTHDHGFQFL